ncbi:MAG: terpene cyclase/mutase family protein [Phycisphaerales bacterium]|nr:terpene cyclase/mutase family protein [Phycisphaerales bacterium]
MTISSALRRCPCSGLICMILAAPTQLAALQAPEARIEIAAQRAVDKGLESLLAAQRPDGGWELQGQSHPAITALAAQCLIRHPRYGPSHPAVERALAFMLRSRHEDGGIYVEGDGMPNYHTSVALMALSATRDEKYQADIEAARRFLKKIQWDEDEDHDKSSVWYGGQGYGNSKRPDLSNTQMMVEALHDSGLSKDDPAYQKAMAFISRCQMLSETNDQPFARGSRDGGFIYSPANGGESKAGTELVEGTPRLRSYGSMTYAGFKSLLYANVGRDDPRIKQALEWIRKHYTLDQNPNMPDKQSLEGLYYYYHVFARAMKAWNEATIVDAGGTTHHWREDLCRKLVSLQREDGSWVNEADRWYEGSPVLVTCYAVLALETALER